MTFVIHLDQRGEAASLSSRVRGQAEVVTLNRETERMTDRFPSVGLLVSSSTAVAAVRQIELRRREFWPFLLPFLLAGSLRVQSWRV